MTRPINKLTKTPPKRRTRPTKTGWHSLDKEELLLWAYMWFERTGNSRFVESLRPWALRLHTTRTTLSRNLEGLIAAKVVYPDKKNIEKTNDGWQTTGAYTVTEPPASVLRYAGAWWEVEAERGKALPSVPKVGHGETLVNSGAPRVLKVDIIATTLNGCNDNGSVNTRPLSIDSVGVPKVGHGETLGNIDDPRVPKVGHVAIPLEDQLSAAEVEWKRLRRLMSQCPNEPPDELFQQASAQGKEVKRLRALLSERAR